MSRNNWVLRCAIVLSQFFLIQPRPIGTAAESDYQVRTSQIADIETAVEANRIEHRVHGLALVIVQKDEIVLMKGFGVRDVRRNLPVTPDTLFAIGSCTKAFTAMAAVIAADEGRLSLDDSPSKYLPYFRLTNESANASVTIRDLLSHRAGIGEDDGRLWALGNRNRRAVIEAGMRAPQKSAPGTSFAYNSIMYSAAGEAVAGAFGLTWEEVIKTRLFEPLGMTASNTSITRTIHANDYSVGYSRNKPVRIRNLENIAPAGAINATARDMAQWLRLLLAGGVWKGKRLVSTDGFRQVTTKQIEDPPGYYGLGWEINMAHGNEIVTHSGAIDGFRAEVDWMPEFGLGWAVMVNEDNTNLHREIGTIIMNKLVP